MQLPLLPSPAPAPSAVRTKRYATFLATLGLLVGTAAIAPAQVQAQTIYGLGTVTSAALGFTPGTQALGNLDGATGMITLFGANGVKPITGVTLGKLVGIDSRPSTGQLFALAYDGSRGAGLDNAQLYTLNTATAVATPVGNTFRLELGDDTERIGFDFNPTVDRIRVVSSRVVAAGDPTTNNYRLNPTPGATGTIGVVADTRLTYVASELNPRIGSVAYLNSYPGAMSTTLYDVDEINGLLAVQNPPADGTLVGVAPAPNPGTPKHITFNGAGFGNPRAIDIDVYFDPATGTNKAYLIEVTALNQPSPTEPAPSTGSTNLYVLDLATGEATTRPGFASANVVPRVTGLEVRDIAVAIAPPPATLTWDGSESTEWKNALNWTPAFVPTATTSVIIPGGTPNEPIVSDAEQANAVNLGSGALLTTAIGGTLNVFGNFTNNGGAVAGAGSGVIALTGTANQTIGGSSATTFFNLRVGTSGATLATPAAIQRLLTLDGSLTNPGQMLTLLSTVSGGTTEQGQVVNNSSVAVPNPTVTGTVTVQRAIDGSLNGQNIGYRHYSSPVTADNLSDLNTTGFTVETSQRDYYNTSQTPRAANPFPNVYGYDQDLIATSRATDFQTSFDKGYFVPNDGFVAGDRRSGLQPGRGYTVNIADDATVDFVGTLNNGDLTMGGLRRDADPRAGYHFLGNPYPSALDFSRLTLTGMEPTLYVFKSTGQYTGFYAPANNGMAVNNGNNLPNILPLGQGFFVRAAAGTTNGSVTFTNSARLTTYDATPFQRGITDERPVLTLALRNAAGRGEQTLIYFEQGATPAYEAAFDSYHLPGPGAPLSLATTGSLSISGQPALTGADVTVPLELSGVATGTYTLAVDALKNLPTGYHAFLRDALTGTNTELADKSSVALNLTANVAVTGRFSVLFTTQAQVLASAPAALAQLAGVYPNPAHGSASLLLPAALRGNQATPVQVVNSLGQVVLRRTLAAGANTTLELPLNGLAAGIYTVRAQTAMGQVVKRLTVE